MFSHMLTMKVYMTLFWVAPAGVWRAALASFALVYVL